MDSKLGYMDYRFMCPICGTTVHGTVAMYDAHKAAVEVLAKARVSDHLTKAHGWHVGGAVEVSRVTPIDVTIRPA